MSKVPSLMSESDPAVIAIYDGRHVLEDYGPRADCIFRWQRNCGWAYQALNAKRLGGGDGRHGRTSCADVQAAGLCRYSNGVDM